MFKTTALDSVNNAYVNEVEGVQNGTILDANDRNIIQDELVNAVESSAQDLDPSGTIKNQLAMAVTIAGAAAMSCEDTGSVNNYVVDSIRDDLIQPSSYDLMDGFMINFDVNVENTGASTLTYNGLGSKNLTTRSGGALPADTMAGNVLCVYNLTSDRWEFLQSNASSGASGVQSITGEAGVISIDGTASVPEVGVESGGIDTGKLANDAVTEDKLDSDSVYTTAIQDEAVTNAKMAVESVDAAQLIDDAVITAKINDGAVTLSKLSDSSSVGSNVQDRVAAAWVEFSGDPSTPTIDASFNVSSVTKVSTGVYRCNFSNIMGGGTYVRVGSCYNGLVSTSGATSSYVEIITRDYSGSTDDSTDIHVIVFQNN